jgi:CheY-like chemotaxis protein
MIFSCIAPIWFIISCMDPSKPPLKVVIVEDNVALADIYKTRLEILGYVCFTAYDGEQALATIQKEAPNLVLLDLMVPKIAGDQILERMRKSDWGKDIKVLVISNLNEAEAPEGLREQGIEGYAVKANLTNDQLDRFVDSILKPEGQEEDTLLETKGSESYPVTATPVALPVQPAPPTAEEIAAAEAAPASATFAPPVTDEPLGVTAPSPSPAPAAPPATPPVTPPTTPAA